MEVPSDPPSRENLFESVMTASRCCNFGIYQSFRFQLHALLQLLIARNSTAGGLQSQVISAQYGTPLMGNLCSRAPHWLSWDFLKPHCSLRLFLPNPYFYPLSSGKYQISIVIQRLSFLLLLFLSFTAIYFLQYISCTSNSVFVSVSKRT